MSAQDNGGSAFPIPSDKWEAALKITHGGMSLRDYFAAKAMHGMYVMVAGRAHSVSAEHPEDDIARHAYLMADAMLKARQS